MANKLQAPLALHYWLTTDMGKVLRGSIEKPLDVSHILICRDMVEMQSLLDKPTTFPVSIRWVDETWTYCQKYEQSDPGYTKRLIQRWVDRDNPNVPKISGRTFLNTELSSIDISDQPLGSATYRDKQITTNQKLIWLELPNGDKIQMVKFQQHYKVIK